MEHDGHAQDGAAVVEGGGQTLPLSLQFAGLDSDRVRGVVARVTQSLGHAQDTGDVHIHILGEHTKWKQVSDLTI